MTEINPQLNQNDHDLLIRVDQKVGNVIDEMRLMRDDTSRRLNAVEENKLNKNEYNEYRVQAQASLIDLEARIKAQMLENKVNRDKENETTTKAISDIISVQNKMWRYIWIAVGITATVSTIASIAGPYIISHIK
jgi:hypothetical protein